MSNAKYKTRLCFWGDKCHNKKKCHFAHTVEELRPLDKIQQPCKECLSKGNFPYYPEKNIGKNINTVFNICNHITYQIDKNDIIRSYIDKCNYIHNERDLKIDYSYDSDEYCTTPPVKKFITSPKLANRKLFEKHYPKPNPVRDMIIDLPLLECTTEIPKDCNTELLFNIHSPDSGFRLIST